MENERRPVKEHKLYIKGEEEKLIVLVIWEHDKNAVHSFLSKCGIEMNIIKKVNFGWAIDPHDLQAHQITKLKENSDKKVFVRHSFNALLID